MAKLSTTNVYGDLYVDGKIVGEIDGAVSATEYTDTSDVSINMDYSAQIGTLSNLKTTEKTNLVNAINELFQNANSGKQLIASAIGEPLDSNDTFSAMSNDINSLLSTFKTNMTNIGVTVNSNDKFKQLIDKITTTNIGGCGLDIISATSLPATGKENQICVITNSPTDKYMISSDVQDDDKTGIFCLTSTIPGSITYTSTSKNTTVKYYMLYFSQNNTIVPSYIYKNGNWAPLTNNRIYLLKDGVYVNEDIFGGLTKTTTHTSYTVNYSAGTGIYGNAYSSYYTHFISSVNRVNFTNFNKVVVRLKVKTDEYDYSGDYHAYVSAWSTPKCVRGANMSDGYNNNNNLTKTLTPTNKSANREKFYFTGTWNYYELDISSWTNTDYLTILIGDTNYCPYWYISDIYIY